MKMKRLAAILLSGLLAVSMAGCGSSGGNSNADSGDNASASSGKDTEDSSSSSGGESSDSSSGGASSELPDISGEDLSGLTIGFSMSNGSGDSYGTSYLNTLNSFADEMGFELILLDAVGDVTKQANQIQDLITQQPDVIVVWPMNSESAVTSVRAIQNAGIPVITANTNVVESGEQYLEGYVGPFNVEEAKLTATQMVEDLGGEGNILFINGKQGYSTSDERKQGLEEAIEGTSIKIIEEQPDEGSREKAQQVMENYLVKYGEGEIDAVFAQDDNGAIGAYNAVESAGRVGEFPIYAGATGDYGTISYIEQGLIRATAVQSPVIDAETALTWAVWMALGNELPGFYNYIETPLATSDNISTLDIAEWES